MCVRLLDSRLGGNDCFDCHAGVGRHPVSWLSTIHSDEICSKGGVRGGSPAALSGDGISTNTLTTPTERGPTGNSPPQGCAHLSSTLFCLTPCHRPSTIGSKTPKPIANSHSAGAGVPTGR